ncbi:MAG: hypothetical protein HZA54_11270 [Planctomycetes bacterium]|nr:hypothetical protein [Planctomycetota bacterium]
MLGSRLPWGRFRAAALAALLVSGGGLLMVRSGFPIAPRVAAFAALAALALGCFLPALLDAAPTVIPDGTWSLTGRHSERGGYTGDMTVARQADGTYRLTATWIFGPTDRETLTGTGKVVGYVLKTTFTRSPAGVVDALNNPTPTPQTETIKGTYTLSRNQERLSGSWVSSLKRSRTGKESLRRSVAPVNTRPDLALTRPDGSVLGEDKEETVGEALPLNLDDDDNDGGAGGDGQNVIVSDLDDANGVRGENDLLTLTVKAIASAPAGSVLKLEWPDAKLGLYRGADHTGRCPGGALELPPGQETTLYVEGRAPTLGGTPEMLTARLMAGAKSLGEDKVALWVTRSAFLLSGHGSMGPWQVEDWLRTARKDSRTNPTIVQGKDRSGKTVYWSVYTWKSQKLAKIALSTKDSVVAYDGHSNFGMGYAFETGFKTVKEFMNIADEQVPVNWEYLRDHQEHPQLMFAEAEYADDARTAEKFDPVQVEGFAVKGKRSTYDHARFPAAGGAGTRMHLTRGRQQRWQDYHYSLGGDDNVRIVVKAGAGDMPAMNWEAIYLHSCYGGQYYWYVFNHGTVYYTTDSASAYNKAGMLFIRSYVEGKSCDDVLKAINSDENINDYWQF